MVKIEKDEISEYLQEGIKAYQIFLHVHHRDFNRENNATENLQVLCPSCHRRVEKEYSKVMRLSEKNQPTK